MASARLAPILADLERHKHAFDLDRDGLAEGLMAVTVDVIERLMDREEAPDGTSWEPLSDAYAAAKARINPGAPMAVLYRTMKTREQLRGESRVTARAAVMVYGTTDEARAEATWFQEGNPDTGQPPRRFYELGDEALAALDRACRAHLDGIIEGRP